MNPMNHNNLGFIKSSSHDKSGLISTSTRMFLNHNLNSDTIEMRNLGGCSKSAPIFSKHQRAYPCSAGITGLAPLVKPTDALLEDPQCLSHSIQTDPVISVEGRADPSLTKSPAQRFTSPHSYSDSKPLLQFLLKGKPDHSLRLSDSIYKRVLKGESKEFYNNNGMHHMVVWVHRPNHLSTDVDVVGDTISFKGILEERYEAAMSLGDSETWGSDDSIEDDRMEEATLTLETDCAKRSTSFDVEYANPSIENVPIFFFQAFKSTTKGIVASSCKLRGHKTLMWRSGCMHGYHQRNGLYEQRQYERVSGFKCKRLMFDPGDFERQAKI